MSKLSPNRRALLGAALATAGMAANHHTTSGKRKKHQKKCHAPRTRCGKKHCCQPGQACVGGTCQAAPTTTTPVPLTEVSCSGFPNNAWGGSRRIAQPFVANGTGAVTSASFGTYGSDPGRPFSVEIRTTNNGVPTSEALGTTFVINLPVVPPNAVSTVIASFDPQVAVRQGVTYALVITDVANQGVSFPVQFQSTCPLDAFIDDDATNDFQPLQDRNLLFTISPRQLTAE